MGSAAQINDFYNHFRSQRFMHLTTYVSPWTSTRIFAFILAALPRLLPSKIISAVPDPYILLKGMVLLVVHRFIHALHDHLDLLNLFLLCLCTVLHRDQLTLDLVPKHYPFERSSKLLLIEERKYSELESANGWSDTIQDEQRLPS